ncbi:MAG: heme ABC exporter ATP-binding protein CcmA [Planctomycetes bacterium]|nr:heme ABC exporter ATP-binding protein CcmA [Planctomycetota bacterium]MCW8135197.1 heme ABC exporter ATP-binding protein CcmA [Planctomycetota bacterium]
MQLEAKSLSRSFGATRALRDVSLSASPGEIVAITGANGAGKSTLVRILATLLRPDTGSFTLAELDGVAEATRVRALIGYLGHESMLDGALTGRENLRLFARLYGVNPSRTDELLARFEVAFADSAVSTMSRGQEQTIGLCRALLHDPMLLLLDEPSTGLDAAAQQRLWQAAREHAGKGRIVIFTTHDHAAAAEVAQRRLELVGGALG